MNSNLVLFCVLSSFYSLAGMNNADEKSAHAGAERGGVHDAKQVESGVARAFTKEDYQQVIDWHKQALERYRRYEEMRAMCEILPRNYYKEGIEGTIKDLLKNLETLQENAFVNVVAAMHIQAINQGRIAEMIAPKRFRRNVGVLTSTEMVNVWADEHHVIELIREIASVSKALHGNAAEQIDNMVRRVQWMLDEYYPGLWVPHENVGAEIRDFVGDVKKSLQQLGEQLQRDADELTDRYLIPIW